MDPAGVPGVCFFRFDTQLRVVEGPGQGRPIAEVLPEGVVAPSDAVWRAVLAGEVRRFELSTPDERGLHLAVATPVTDEAGHVTGGLAVTFDASQRQQAELELRERETEFRSLAEHATDIVTRHTPDGTVLYVSPSVSELGIEPEDLVGRPIYDLVHEEDRDRVRRAIDPAIRAGQTITVAYRLRTGGDEVRWLETTCAGISGDDGRVTEVRCSTQDITARHRDAEELERRLAQQSAVAALGERALTGMPVGDLMREACEAVSRTLDVPLAVVLEFERGSRDMLVAAGVGVQGGMLGARLTPPEEVRRSAFRQIERGPVTFLDLDENPRGVFIEPLREHHVVSGTAVPLGERERPMGMLCAYSTRRRVFTDDDTNLLQAVSHVLATAIAARRAEDQARHDAMHDPLTGLPNRVLFSDRLAQALARSERDGSPLAVLLLDIDRFKLINDSLGHLVGDELLREVAPRLSGAVRASDTVARLGGDEFAVLCEDLEDEREAQEMAERLGACFLRPFALGGEQQFATASVGLVVADSHTDAEELLRDADAAMYRAKEAGRGRYEVFDEGMRARAVARLQVENELRRALDREELQLFFQPIHDLQAGRIASCEALVRWNHPERGLVGPDQFIPIAEESGLIVPLGAWVLQRACRQLARWRRSVEAADSLRITVNLSARQVTQPDIVDTVAEAIEEAGLDPQDIGLEITEHVLIEDAQTTADTLRRLQRLGVRLVIDDFGTGYSSLSYLKRYPIEVLKIDRSFIDGIADDESGDLAIVTAIVRMASALGVDVIPEGVETEAQLQALRDLGCQYAQGFLLDRPLPPEELEARLRG
ncbi:EAL domain-containing protein [Svornostia abyssi]|uniref:EAL domain-containing protein n=1 Tax=Svornostia abyssi TaxID=2898438 RepID=A0ABY5PGY7_9ACTN|nr:EAL domain-containing protein [Parviterribacteraceae bacterium J379]